MSGNIARLFAQHRSTPARVLYRHYVGDAWADVSAAEVAQAAGRWQAAFRREGFAAGDRIAICARNGLNWVAVDLAALGMGLVVVPLYVDDNPDNVAWCVRHAQARLLIVDNSRIAAGIATLADAGHPLPPVVVLRPDDGETAQTAAAYLPAEGGELAIVDVPPAALATICFTSGTSGRPRGVMLSHGNILANVEQCRATGMARADDLFLSILPLSHMFERTGGYYLPLAIGARVAFCRGVAHVAEDLGSQAPTVMFAVPRILERFHERIERALAKSPVKRMAFAACVARGYRVATRGASALDRLVVPLLRRLVAEPVLQRLGGRLRLAVVGGAALDPELARTFMGLGLTVLQGYGMTEASPVISVNRDDDNVPESVGRPLAGIAVRLGDANELHVHGPNVMQGYWRDPEATAAALAPDGWLRTGDQAEIEDGRLFIRGRLKDVLVMSNGEKLAPQDAEFAILHDPVFEQVMLVGEGRPYLVLLAVTREQDAKKLAKRANERLGRFPRWIRVRRVVAMREPWSVDNGLLTPTLKLKRPLLLKKLSAQIDRAYAEPPA